MTFRVFAVVTLTVEVHLEQPWGGSVAAGDIAEAATRLGPERLRQAIQNHAEIRIVGATKVKQVCLEEA